MQSRAECTPHSPASRLRRSGWRILRSGRDMVLHDAAIDLYLPQEKTRQQMNLGADEGLKRWLSLLDRPIRAVPDSVEVKAERSGDSQEHQRTGVKRVAARRHAPASRVRHDRRQGEVRGLRRLHEPEQAHDAGDAVPGRQVGHRLPAGRREGEAGLPVPGLEVGGPAPARRAAGGSVRSAGRRALAARRRSLLMRPVQIRYPRESFRDRRSAGRRGGPCPAARSVE